MFLTRPSVHQSVSLRVSQSCFSSQGNTSETTEHNFLKLCSNNGHNVKMCISTGNFNLIVFLRIKPFLNLEIWRKWKILLTQFVSATPLKPLIRTSWNFVVMKDLMCRCAYPQEILIQFFSGSNAPFLNLEIWPKLKILLKTVCQCNSSEIAQQNIVKLCSYKGHSV